MYLNMVENKKQARKMSFHEKFVTAFAVVVMIAFFLKIMFF